MNIQNIAAHLNHFVEAEYRFLFNNVLTKVEPQTGSNICVFCILDLHVRKPCLQAGNLTSFHFGAEIYFSIFFFLCHGASSYPFKHFNTLITVQCFSYRWYFHKIAGQKLCSLSSWSISLHQTWLLNRAAKFGIPYPFVPLQRLFC